MKECRRCQNAKAVSEFYKDRRTPDGLRRWCKDCWNMYQRARWADGRTDRAKKAAADRAWRKANPGRAAAIWRRSYLKRKFGITVEDYQQRLLRQNGTCAVCSATESGDSRFDTFHVDHDHDTGRVRGLLCLRCNAALGQVQDDVDRLMGLAAYILQSRDTIGSLLSEGSHGG